MPVWLMRLIWKVRGKRLARLHLLEEKGTPVSTLEGVLLGRWSGHYVLLLPKVVGEDGATSLEGTVEVPAERVVFVQVLGRGVR